MRLISILLSFLLLHTSNVFACVKNEPRLISLKFSEVENSNFLDLEISLPKFYEAKRLNSMHLIHKNNSGEASTVIPLGYEIKVDTVYATVSMKSKEYESWDVAAMYSKIPETKIENDQKVTYHQLDGCVLEARKNLKHNKSQNNAPTGPDAA